MKMLKGESAMWNHDKSLVLSILSVKIFFVLWCILLIGGYFITKAYVEYMDAPNLIIPILPALYACLIPAFFILLDLYKVLMNIRNEEVFVIQNEKHLRRISWACIVVAMITIVSAFGYLPFLFIAVAFGFFGLLIRIIKNIVAQAIVLKMENDYTI